MADQRFFKTPKPLTLAEILIATGATVPETVDRTVLVHDVASLQTAESQHLSFFDNRKYLDVYKQSRAGFCFVIAEDADKAPKGMVALVTKTPYKAYALAAQRFYPQPSWNKSYFAPTAHIDPTAQIGANCIIDHNVYVGRHAKIGTNTWLKPNTVVGNGVEIGSHTIISSNCSLSHCLIGNNVRILPGVRIGQEGFGFAIDPAGHIPVPQLGRVIIGDRVWIGANTTIDRGAGPDTVVGDGCMIDNLVQIAHNVKIGKHVVIVAQVGIAGSAEIDDYAVLAGQVGVAGHLKVGRGARIGAQSGLMKDVPPGIEMMGSPAVPLKEFFRQVSTVSQLIKRPKTVNE